MKSFTGADDNLVTGVTLQFFAQINPEKSNMEPSQIITWAVCLGLAWLIFASLTGADEWAKSLFGKSKTRDLQARVEQLEKRVDELSKK